MKAYLFIIILFFAVSVHAQTTTRTTTKLDENTIVKDSSGTVLPYSIWQKLMQTGEYNLKKVTGLDEFVAYKMNDVEKARADERRKAAILNMPKPRQAASLKEGEKFKGDKFTDINGNKYDLKTSIDKVYVINFWFINCPPCKQEIPELNKVVEKYKDNKNVVFIGIGLDNKTDLAAFLKTTPFNYNIIDEGRFYAQKYEIDGYPTHVIVGKDGLIKFSTIGLAGNTVYWIEKTIGEQLKGI
ncbi:TlpA family protein disulfide reductase [Pedobacter frigiditerrae]|uniref:TlpA family protein disulfide reductase n=1 Tax=Pedobacter frigiditerrae TaxID=2530452 RepID=A0A4R0MT84_9SPHI|nr:TlpA disulfide reductase family protein [Pedobacter frigiditerrae]TCC90248.1 TlpA family protein disulfide reductase [Pedobacter frigiditerrae]